MRKCKWISVISALLALVLVVGLVPTGIFALADTSLLKLDIGSEYIAPGSGSGATAEDPIKIIKTIPDRLLVGCTDASAVGSDTYVYLYKASVKDPAIGATDFTDYSDYNLGVNKNFPTYRGTRSKKLILDGWGADATAYTTTVKPTGITYVLTLWKENKTCDDKLYFVFVNEDGSDGEVTPTGPRFTNTETKVAGSLTLKYTGVDTSVGTITVMLYRWKEGWDFASEKTKYLNESGYYTYNVIKNSEGTVTYSSSLLRHYGSGKYVAVLGGPGWANYNEYHFEYDADALSEDEKKKLSMVSTILPTDTMSFDVKCTNTVGKDWVALYPKGFTDMYKYYDYVYCGSKISFPSGQAIRYTQGEYMPLPEGEYVLVLYENDTYSEASRLEFKVEKGAVIKSISISATAYVAGNSVNVTTSNFFETDGDFIRVYKESETDLNKYIYDSKADGVKATYSIKTDGWEKGEYKVIGFTGNSTANIIGEKSFSIKGEDDKMVYISKSTWFTSEDLIIKTKNWSASDRDFLRIYKKPHNGNFNQNFVYQTYNDWGKSQYVVPLSGFEVGDYCIYAWDKGDYSLPIVAYIEFTVEEESLVEGDGSYTNDGSVINIINNCRLDLSQCRHNEVEGKLFNGWVDANGDAVENGSILAAGTVLTASYVDVNSDPEKLDFGIREVEIRTDGKLGLRFIVEKANAFCEKVDIMNYGTVALPAEILNGTLEDRKWKDLKYGETYTFDGKEYTPATIKGLKTYENFADRMYFTCCLQGLKPENFTTQYVVKAYLNYRDCNGIERIYHTDYSSANPYMIAREELSGEKELTEAQISVLKNIVSTVETAKEEEISSKTVRNVRGTSDDLNGWIYQLGTGGIMLREAEFDSGKGGDPVTIVQISDLHYNYMNDVDFTVRNPTLISTYNARTWGANGAFALNTRHVIDYAMTADEVVVTGDVMDYLSEGCIELMYKELWDRIPNAIIAAGNHEYVQQMQGGIAESIPLAKRWEMVQDAWKHNVYYHSKVVDDKVMIIQLNNGERKFYENQIEPLTNDLALAREKGYVVLMFMHETIVTNNPAMASVNALRANDAGWATGENFYTDPNRHHVGGSDADTATRAVHNLILGNADIIKGVFNGHIHSDFYTEILGTSPNGGEFIIPQYTLTGSAYDNGHALKITVK